MNELHLFSFSDPYSTAIDLLHWKIWKSLDPQVLAEQVDG